MLSSTRLFSLELIFWSDLDSDHIWFDHAFGNSGSTMGVKSKKTNLSGAILEGANLKHVKGLPITDEEAKRRGAIV